MIQRPMGLLFVWVFGLNRIDLTEVTQRRRPTLKDRTTLIALATAMLWMAFGIGVRAEAAGIVLNTPAGLSSGEAFRFVFVTDGTTYATSTNIADYNNFVNAQAGGATYNGSVVTWDAIASTATVNAIDNVGQTPTPVYLADGTLVTTSTTSSGLWSGSLLIPAPNEDLSGVTFPQGTIVWTGTNPVGLGVSSLGVLGAAEPYYGALGALNGGWVSDYFSTFGAVGYQMYGISQVLVASGSVPEPSTLILAGTAIIAGAAHSSTRRRR
jgi:hypothetical protein